MSDVARQIWRDMCEKRGLSWAKGQVASQPLDIQAHIREWIHEQDRNESAAREKANRLLSEKAVAAAQLSAETSAAAAEASKKSARWTMIASIAAAASAIILMLQAFGWLPK